MKINPLVFLCLSLVSLSLWCACSGSGDEAGVTGTETKIYGQVLDSTGKAVSEARVRLYSVDSEDSTDTVMVSEQVAQDGSFSFSGIDPGTYVLRALKDSTLLGFSDPVTLAAGEQKNVNIIVIIVVQQNFYITNINIANLWVEGDDALVGLSGGAIQLLSDGKGGQFIYLVVQLADNSQDTLVYQVEKSSSGSVLVLVDSSTVRSSSSESLSSSSSCYEVVSSSSSLPIVSSSSSLQAISSSGVSCTGTDGVIYGTNSLTDCRDGQTYKTVVIGEQTWLAQNMNYAPDSGNSWCYDGEASNCVNYGRLYDWATAMAIDTIYNSARFGDTLEHQGVCPAGWHVPRNSEWEILIDSAGGTSVAGGVLKAKSDLWSSNVGTDALGFSALPGGYYDWNPDLGTGSFSTLRYYGYWWSATGYGPTAAFSLSFGLYANARPDNSDRTNGYSIRCVKDSGT